jgi:hypothetical protein
MRLKSILLMACLALMMAGLVSAQSQGSGRLNFTAASAFVVGNTTLPAGSYKIRPTDDTNLFEITAASGQPSVMFEVSDSDVIGGNKKTEVNFSKYGDHLILKNFMVQNENSMFTVVTSFVERKSKAAGKPTKVANPATKG